MASTEQLLTRPEDGAPRSTPLANGGHGTFVPIPVDALCATSTLGFDLYLRSSPKSPPVLYRERRGALSAHDIARLRQADVERLFVRVGDDAEFRRYLEEELIGNREIPPARRYAMLKELNRRVFDAALRGNNLSEILQVADAHTSQVVDIICDRDLVLRDLFSLMDHDYYTYTHATNVCAFCLVLASRLGIASRLDLSDIGTAALLHDLGKRKIPTAVLNKQGELTPDEQHLVQEHPRTAFDELAPRGDLSWDQLLTIYQHHERLDGSGYPVGLAGQEIHDWSRMCMIADVFDALTSKRPYRKPDPVGKVVDFMQRSAGRLYDKEMVTCWIAITKPLQ